MSSHRMPPDRLQWKEFCISSVKFSQKFIIWVQSRGNIKAKLKSILQNSWLLKKCQGHESRGETKKLQSEGDLGDLMTEWSWMGSSGLRGHRCSSWRKATQAFLAVLQQSYVWNCFKTNSKKKTRVSSPFGRFLEPTLCYLWTLYKLWLFSVK